MDHSIVSLILETLDNIANLFKDFEAKSAKLILKVYSFLYFCYPKDGTITISQGQSQNFVRAALC